MLEDKKHKNEIEFTYRAPALTSHGRLSRPDQGAHGLRRPALRGVDKAALRGEAEVGALRRAGGRGRGRHHRGAEGAQVEGRALMGKAPSKKKAAG